MDIVSGIIEVLKYFGFNNPAQAGGWIVSVFVSGFMIWRISVVDKKYDEFVDKISKVIVAQEEEWRKLVTKTDDMTFEMLEASTKTMTTLTEKINTLQLILLQLNGKNK